MAGSLKWFVYTDDSSEEWAYRADESNTEAVVSASGESAGTADYTASSTAIYAIPRNLTPRRVTFRNADGTVSRTIIAPTAAVYAGLTAGDTITDQTSGQTLSFAFKRGESLSVPVAQDTGLNDGDAT